MIARPTRISDAGAESVSPWGKDHTPRELADLWQLSENSIRRLFADEPGVFILGESNPRNRRGDTTLRIPSAVAERVFSERMK